MSQKLKIRMFLGFAILCWVVIACWAMYTHQQGSAVDPIHDSIHGNIYANSHTFSVARAEDAPTYNQITGAVLPNAKNNPKALGESMAALKANLEVSTVVVVSFSDNVGNAVITGDWGWQTPYSVVQTDKNVLSTLIDKGLKSDNIALDKNANLGIMMDYCSYYLPGTAVVPVVLDKNMSYSDVIAALAPYKNILNEMPILVSTPESSSEDTLPLTEIDALSSLISQVDTTDYSGVFESEAGLALKTLSALLPQSHGSVITSLYSGAAENQATKFSDLLIFCEQ